MPRWIALALALTLGLLVAWGASRTPSPRPEAPGRFSGQRAMGDVEELARRPHPLGSAEHDRVRDVVLARFRAAGLETRVQQGRAIEPRLYGGEAFLEGGRVQNIVAVLPGRSRTAPAVAIMAHYDTVPASPGAADDTVGVATALEIARLMKAAPPPERDVVFLITDGEEAGLLGARSFFASDPLSRRIGAVLNMESRGGGGRVYMFQAGAGDGGMIDLFARSAVNPTASSLSGYVYAHMPNDTDFTVSMARGIAGLNYAFIGRPFDYHAASSTAAALDQGSLQHMGEQVLAAARALADAKALPARRADVVYSDLLGGPMVVYPGWAGWIVVLMAAGIGAFGLSRGFRGEPFKALDAVRGAAALILAVGASAAVMALARHLTGVGPGFADEKALYARFGAYEAAMALAGLGGTVLAFAVTGLGRPRFWSALAGAFAVALVLAAAAQAAAPLAAYLLAWPLLVLSVLTAVLSLRWRGDWSSASAAVFAAVLAALPLAQILYVAHAVALGVGADLPWALAIFSLMGSLVLFPLLWPASPGRVGLVVGAAALMLSLVIVLGLRLTHPWTARHPRPTEAAYVDVTDTGQFWRASLLRRVDDWSRRMLQAWSSDITTADLQPLARRAHVTLAHPAGVVPPSVDLTRDPAGRVTFLIAPRSQARELRLDIRSEAAAAGALVDGEAAPAWSAPGAWTHIVWHGAAAPLQVSFLAPKGAVEVRWAEIVDGWPAGAAPLPPRPAQAMPWMNSDAAVVIGKAKLAG